MNKQMNRTEFDEYDDVLAFSFRDQGGPLEQAAHKKGEHLKFDALLRDNKRGGYVLEVNGMRYIGSRRGKDGMKLPSVKVQISLKTFDAHRYKVEPISEELAAIEAERRIILAARAGMIDDPVGFATEILKNAKEDDNPDQIAEKKITAHRKAMAQAGR